jgi:hypothetical protein
MKYASSIWVVAISSATLLAGCAAPTGYEKAFSQATALSGNSRAFSASSDQIFRTVKITLVQQGFTIEQADSTAGLLRAVRILQDPQKAKLAYLITTTVDVSGAPSGDATIVTLSASQQTVLHKDSNKYYKLLGLVPIPTGKDYQTVVRKEGNIGTVQFYTDFFDAVDKNLKQARVVTTPLPDIRVATAPLTPVTRVSPTAAASVSETVSSGSADGAMRQDAPLPADPRMETHGAVSEANPSPAITANAPTSTPEKASAEAPPTPQPPSIQTMANPFSEPPASPADKPQ